MSAFAKLQDKFGMANKDASDACAVHADDSSTVCADAGCYWDAFPDEDGDRCVPTIASEGRGSRRTARTTSPSRITTWRA